MEPIDRENRLRLANLFSKLPSSEIKTKNNIKQRKKEEGMLRFWISEDESKQLDSMTVRALAENP
jgi:hypothetical protein